MTKPLWDHIRFQARLRPGALAVFGPAGPVTYQTLVNDTAALATELLERALTRHDMVGLHMGFSYLHLLLIVALDRLGIPSMSFESRGAVPASPDDCRRFGLTAIISGETAPADPPRRWITMAEPDRPTLGKPDPARLARLDSPPDALVRVMWSSGTTGGAKGSLLTRSTQHHRNMVRRRYRGFGPRTRYFTGIPLSTGPGYGRVIAVLSAGGAVVLPCPPTDFVSLANTVGVTVAGSTPATLSGLLDQSGAAGRRLETVELLDVLGAHLPTKLAQDARLRLTPNIWISYGSTEADQVATADAAVGIADASAVGFLMPCIEAQIVDAADRPVPNGQEGVLRVRGDQVVAGYHDNPEATRRNFRDGWFYAGDLGVISDQGLLRVTGRIEELITRDGASVSALPLEEAIRGVPGVRDVAVFALTGADGAQEICAALVLDPGADAPAIRRAAAQKLGDQAPTRVFMIDSLPRNAAGKVLRRQLVEMARRAVKL
jgi:2,3-dihydroxybenzoate-AMP ligase